MHMVRDADCKIKPRFEAPEMTFVNTDHLGNLDYNMMRQSQQNKFSRRL